MTTSPLRMKPCVADYVDLIDSFFAFPGLLAVSYQSGKQVNKDLRALHYIDEKGNSVTPIIRN